MVHTSVRMLTVLLAAAALLVAPPSSAGGNDTRTVAAGLYLPDVALPGPLQLCTDTDDPSSCTVVHAPGDGGALRSLEVVLEYTGSRPPALDTSAGTPLPATAGRACSRKTGAVVRLVVPTSHGTARLSVRRNGRLIGQAVVLTRSKRSAPEESLFAPGLCY